MKKIKILSVFTILAIILSTFTVNAARLNVLYQKVDEQILGKGITQTDYKMLSTVGWINANVIKADISDKYIDIKPLFSSEGSATLETTKSLATENNAIAAVNADFFAWSNYKGKGSSIGLLVKDGQLITSAANNNEMAALVQNKDKIMSILYPSSYVEIVAPNGQKQVVKHINKYDPLDNIVIYNNKFNKMSLGAKNGVCEAVVKNGILTEILTDNDSIEIPDDTYIITFLADYSGFMFDNFKIGDNVILNMFSEPSLDGIKNAIGGGTQLVTQGQPAKITHQVNGIHPRTAVGIDKEGKTLFLITVDGRGLSRGISLEALTEFMITIGVYDGMNFDGGGSTMMTTRQLGSTQINVANVPSETRAISNALGIVSTAPKGKLLGIKTKASQQFVFKNTSCNFSTLAYDEYYNPIEIDENKVEYVIDGVNGSFEGRVFKPTSSGKAKITSKFDGVSTTVEMTVLDDPNSLSITPQNIDVANSANVSVVGKDKDGYCAPIYINDLSIEIDKNIADVINGSIVKKGDGDTVLAVSLGNSKAYVGVSTISNSKNISIPNNIYVADYLNKSVSNGNTFTVFGDALKPINLLQNLILQHSISELNKYQSHYFVGDIDESQFENVNGSKLFTKGYGDKKDENSHYIWLNNTNGGLRETATEQWPFLISKISSTDKNNVFIFLPKDIYNGGFTDSLEAEAFFDVLNKELISKGKNCFVFANNDVTSTQRINGIRYITTGGIEGSALDIFRHDMTKTKYITVTVSEKNVSYEVKNVFQ